MKERLLGFIFVGVLVDMIYNAALDRFHAHYSGSLWLQRNWIWPYVAAPAALLLGLAALMGFFRKNRPRWADAAAVGVTALLVYLTLGAGYSCWKYCF
ncbi:MAG TPA: hypothetical protein VHC40_11415 [Rhizomicrobium sp.]|nr:hypothetical protein [Rhizomicrobium sp.]